MDKTLFIASFPDLGSFDFSKTGIRVGNIDNSDYYFRNNVTYIHSYIESLKKSVLFYIPIYLVRINLLKIF